MRIEQRLWWLTRSVVLPSTPPANRTRHIAQHPRRLHDCLIVGLGHQQSGDQQRPADNRTDDDMKPHRSPDPGRAKAAARSTTGPGTRSALKEPTQPDQSRLGGEQAVHVVNSHKGRANED
jgi:hypothetical protein